jgi:RNase P/RNase MRP subunit POP5
MVTIERDRYVVFKILLDDTEKDLGNLKREIWSMYQKLFGLDGTTEAGLYFEEFNKEKQIGLVRCNSKSLSYLMTSFAMISKIDDTEIMILPLFVTGLINKAKKYILGISGLNRNVD